VAWGDNSSGSSQVYLLGDTLNVQKIIYVNDSLSAADAYTKAAGAASNNGLSATTPLDSIQSALKLATTPGTVILVDGGDQDGFDVSAVNNGVIIIGSPGAATVVTSDVTISGASNVTIDGLQLAGGLTASDGNNIELVNNTGGSTEDISSGTGGTFTLKSSTNVLVEHNVVGGLTLQGATTGITIRSNQI